MTRRTFSVAALFLVLLPLQGFSYEVTVGPGGFLHKDGAPVFTLGAYSPPKGKSAQDAADMGFNVLHVGGGEDQWKACAEAGLGVWHSFNLDFSQEVEKRKEAVKSVVERYADHPNLFMWESVDEPAWTDGQPEKPRNLPEDLTAGYQYLKSLDDHPVYLNHAPRNTVETLRKYNPAADILCVDVYPIIPRNLTPSYAIIPPENPIQVPRQTDLPDLSPAVVGDYVDKMHEVAYHDQAVFLVLQGFAWEALQKEEDRNPENLYYPTLEQLRFMAWQAIVHGVNGLTVWGLSYNDNAQNLADLSSVLQEIRSLEPFIVGHRTGDLPTLRYEERGSGIVKGVECLVTEREDAVTLFTVNASINPATVRFTSLPPAFDGATELVVLGEDRNITLEHGTFRDDYAGLGVHLYQYRR
jgi:hypothetical protein